MSKSNYHLTIRFSPGAKAFFLYSLESLKVEGKDLIIHTGAFSHCPNLRIADIRGVQRVGFGAFYNCKLHTVVMSAGIKRIESKAFYGNNLSWIIVDCSKYKNCKREFIRQVRAKLPANLKPKVLSLADFNARKIKLLLVIYKLLPKDVLKIISEFWGIDFPMEVDNSVTKPRAIMYCLNTLSPAFGPQFNALCTATGRTLSKFNVCSIM